MVLHISHYAFPALAVIIVLLCLRALLKRRMPSLGKARLIDSKGNFYQIKYRETSIGRNKTCDVIIEDETVSKLHAVIVCAKDGWYIADSSGASTTVNGLKVNKRADVASGDRIGLGKAQLIFENIKEKD